MPGAGAMDGAALLVQRAVTWGYHGRGRPTVKTSRVTCAVCGRTVGAHKWGRGGGWTLAARHHNPATRATCAGSFQRATPATTPRK